MKRYITFIRNHMKLFMGFALTGFAGVLLGFLVQAGDIAADCGNSSGLLASFGTVTFGFFFWITVCSTLALRSRCGLHASLLVLTLLSPMLVSYRIAAWCMGGYVNTSLLAFGLLMLLPSAIAAWILRASNDRRLMQVFLGQAGVLALLFDLSNRGCVTRLYLLMMLALLGVFLRTVSRMPASREARRRTQSALCMYRMGQQL